MTIKKILATLLALSMTLSLAACGGNSTQTDTTAPSEQTEESSSVSDESASDETTAENTETETPSDETEASEPAEKVDINLAALSGPTALGMLDLLEKNDNGEAANNYNVTIATAPEEIESIRAALPELPDSRYARYTGEWGIPAADAGLLVKYRKVAEYFEEAAQGVTPKTAANFILGQIFRRLKGRTDH